MTASDEGFGAAIGELRDRGSHGGGQCGEQDAHEQALLLVHDSVPQLARAIGWTLAGDELVPHQSEQLAGHDPAMDGSANLTALSPRESGSFRR